MGNDVAKTASFEENVKDASINAEPINDQTKSFTDFLLGGGAAGDLLSCNSSERYDPASNQDGGGYIENNEVEVVATRSTDEVYLLSSAVSNLSSDDVEDLSDHLSWELENMSDPTRREFILERHTSSSPVFFDAQDSYDIDDLIPQEYDQGLNKKLNFDETSTFSDNNSSRQSSSLDDGEEPMILLNSEDARHSIPTLTPEKALSLLDDVMGVPSADKNKVSLSELDPSALTKNPSHSSVSEKCAGLLDETSCSHCSIQVNGMNDSVIKQLSESIGMKKNLSEERIPSTLCCCNEIFSGQAIDSTVDQHASSTDDKALLSYTQDETRNDETFDDLLDVQRPSENAHVDTAIDQQEVGVCFEATFSSESVGIFKSDGQRPDLIKEEDTHELVSATPSTSTSKGRIDEESVPGVKTGSSYSSIDSLTIDDISTVVALAKEHSDVVEDSPLKFSTSRINSDSGDDTTMIGGVTSQSSAIIGDVDKLGGESPMKSEDLENAIAVDVSSFVKEPMIENDEPVIDIRGTDSASARPLEVVLDNGVGLASCLSESQLIPQSSYAFVESDGISHSTTLPRVDSIENRPTEKSSPIYEDAETKSVSFKKAPRKLVPHNSLVIKSDILDHHLFIPVSEKFAIGKPDSRSAQASFSSSLHGIHLEDRNESHIHRSSVDIIEEDLNRVIELLQSSNLYPLQLSQSSHNSLDKPMQIYSLPISKKRIRAIEFLESTFGRLDDFTPQEQAKALTKWHQTLSQSKHENIARLMKIGVGFKNFYFTHFILKGEDKNGLFFSQIMGMNQIFNISEGIEERLPPMESSAISEGEKITKNHAFLHNKVAVDYDDLDTRKLPSILLSIAQSDLNYFTSIVKEMIQFSVEKSTILNAHKTTEFSIHTKKQEDILTKAKRKYRGDVLQVKDILRGSILFQDETSLFRSLLFLHHYSQSHPEFCIVRVKNLFWSLYDGYGTRTNLPTGYRHILVTVRLKSGLLAEIQLQIKAMFDVLGNQGYKLHKLATALDLEKR